MKDYVWTRIETVARRYRMSIADLARLDDRELMKFPGLGKKTVRTLRERHPYVQPRCPTCGQPLQLSAPLFAPFYERNAVDAVSQEAAPKDIAKDVEP